MNTVGPYHNRQETYGFFSLPFCRGPKKDISHYHETLGEALQGTELEFSGLDIDFASKCGIHVLSSALLVLYMKQVDCLPVLIYMYMSNVFFVAVIVSAVNKPHGRLEQDLNTGPLAYLCRYLIRSTTELA